VAAHLLQLVNAITVVIQRVMNDVDTGNVKDISIPESAPGSTVVCVITTITDQVVEKLLYIL
jgi:hypothetical protein